MEGDPAGPASGVRVTVRGPQLASEPQPKNPKRALFPLIRGLLPIIIVALLAVLLLGGTGGILVFVGLVLVAALVWFAVERQKRISRSLYSESPSDWMSRIAMYEGPFDQTGLAGAASFERQHSMYNNPPQVRLVVTADGLEFGPAGHSGTPMKIPFTELESVVLVPGPRKRMLVVTPATSDRLGTVEVMTTAGRLARFSGIPSGGLQTALVREGARIVATEPGDP